jgi:hypothetical protein
VRAERRGNNASKEVLVVRRGTDRMGAGGQRCSFLNISLLINKMGISPFYSLEFEVHLD